jgi:hypothetical protein
MRVNFNTMTEAEPRLVSRIKAWAGEEKKRLARALVKKAICRWGVQEPAEPYQG